MSKTAFIFPGQGSQAVGMLADLADKYPIIEHTFAEASEALGYDLWQLVQKDEEGKLNQTEFTQPALLTASVALWRLWQQENGSEPAFLAGHSLGEYSALVAAGVIELSDAVKLVEARGQFMQLAVPEGTGKMAAIIGLDDEKVRDACAVAAQDEVVEAVNYNSPGQVVIAGSAAAVERAMEACKAAGAKRALPLPVSVPSHCALMRPAADKLAHMLESININTPVIPVINNVDVAAESDPKAIKDALIRQLYNPVRWTETVQKLKTESALNLFECGPGNVLCGLAKRIDRELNASPLGTLDKFEAALSE
ncbi:[acyl-carrier-protein] S-malonyltransferase [Kangiella profundi]|uniref:Malonyl CoA-acyl carrier protein transacylase n=1 Tax=Kangiella profundi TaxID=1561924 RepID=A0A2K9A7S6_9GAMM|nr:ACP S-malonyltransferase [Kangiella profundi]AUD78770.1 [acyl-carrier-protein] S-malonyltransferase [Kangiella profundi]GGF04378.1 malonyl CoA-acyl carrier protein transacylase [Kangiella profundi]